MADNSIVTNPNRELLGMWLDISDYSVLIGCPKCPSFRYVFATEEEARKAGKKHASYSPHNKASYTFVILGDD